MIEDPWIWDKQQMQNLVQQQWSFWRVDEQSQNGFTRKSTKIGLTKNYIY